ncbi:efflux RND transporter periplasmic adaptor subunit [bacterium]|nr:efflux RND transporter periplasmic adaptor subunit [bacterium]
MHRSHAPRRRHRRSPRGMPCGSLVPICSAVSAVCLKINLPTGSLTMTSKSRLTIPAGLLAVLGLSTLLLIGCAGDEPEAVEEKQARPVSVIRTEVIERPERLQISGRVTHRSEAMLAFRSGGFVNRIHVEEGDAFKQGDLLASLDTTEVAAGLQDAVAQRRQLERDVKRLRNLHEEDVATLRQLQEAETGLERARAAEQRARFTLEKAKIVAPFDGYIAMVIADEGEMHGEGKPVMRVVDNAPVRRVQVGVPARFSTWITEGRNVAVHMETLEEPVQGRIIETGAVADPHTGNVLLKLELPARKGIFEGVIARVDIPGPPRKVIPLPAGALAEGDDDRAFVYIVEDGTALRREVRIVEIYDDSVYVRPTLPAKAVVVSKAAGFLRDGETVAIDGESDR